MCFWRNERKSRRPGSRFVVPDHADRQHRNSEIGQVVDGIAGAARHHRTFAMAQDQHRGLARYPRNLAVDELVGDQVSQHGDAELGKLLDDLYQTVARSRVLLHGAMEIFSCPA
jgi:hypothetical protein